MWREGKGDKEKGHVNEEHEQMRQFPEDGYKEQKEEEGHENVAHLVFRLL
jgi:hypothetical protein